MWTGNGWLNFVGNAAYYDIEEGKDNIAQFEFIPWILGTCANLEEAKTALIHMNLTNTPYSEQFPLAQLTGSLQINLVRSQSKQWKMGCISMKITLEY